MKTFTCPFHGGEFTQEQSCPDCFDIMQGDVPESAHERSEELQKWADNVLTVDFSILHKRIEELVGRPVWTHELADIESLRKEIEKGKRASFIEVIDKIPADKQVVIAVMGDE
jgi:hypothetical protein